MDISSKPFDSEEDTLKGKTGGDEYLREAGSDNEISAAEFIKQYEKEHDDLNKETVDKLKSQIKAEKDTVFGYEENLQTACNEELSKLDWLPGWRFQAFATNGNPIYFGGHLFETKYGLLILIKDSKNKISYRAFSITRDVEIDYQAMKNLVSQAENMIDSFKKLLYLTNPSQESEMI